MQDARFRSSVRRIASRALFVFLMTQPAAAQTTTLNLSQDLVALGIASTNMLPNQPALDAGPLLNKGVGYAMAHQISRH